MRGLRVELFGSLELLPAPVVARDFLAFLAAPSTDGIVRLT